MKAAAPVSEALDALGFQAREQLLADLAAGHLHELRFGLEDVGQVEDLELPGAQRSELGQRRGEHLHRTELQCFQFFLVLVELAVRINLYLDAPLGGLLGQLLEAQGRLALGRVRCHDMAELDDDGCLRERRRHGPGEQREGGSSQSSPAGVKVRHGLSPVLFLGRRRPQTFCSAAVRHGSCGLPHLWIGRGAPAARAT